MSEASARSRGRPRLFDEEAVLDELTSLFWEKGYAHTSMADLVEASGVHKSSLYSTFGSKEELFSKILRRYLDGRMDGLSALIEQAGPGIDGIHGFLELIRESIVSGGNRQGCLLVNSSSELHGTAPGFENFGVEYRAALRARIRELILPAEPEDAPSPVITAPRTDLFVTFMAGLNVTVRGGADELEIGRVIDAMHATVDTWRT
jgi:TetR/AcrR family transcriptional repressor of nem operon